ncbi:MAG: 4Fe-4S dicluster domain-containing protein [Gemmatimonadetes bacterium]|nr:4Fe-4S dicluster domain-containing protein [Gemmatimonadota bacterium]
MALAAKTELTASVSPDPVVAPLADEYDGLLACIHCGFCLPACPTYEVLGDENDSPRGRLYLMRAVAEGRLSADDPAFALHIDRCLGCRACEPVCPSGVRYGFLLERARAVRKARRSVADRVARRILNAMFARPTVQSGLWAVARAARALHVPDVVARLRLGRPGRLRYSAATLAASRRPRLAQQPWLALQSRAGGRRPQRAPRERVALLLGCVMEGLLAAVNRATRRVLEAAGAEVIEIRAGLCCGALHAHAGELETARVLARRMINAFEATGAAVLMTNSAGCGAAMKEYAELLTDDPEYAERAARASRAVRDISEWLDGRPTLPYGELRLRVAYDAACHLWHAQGVREPPLRLLRSVPGLEVVELPRADRCCGAAGIYSLLQPSLSREVLDRKIDEIRGRGAPVVATGNPGCILHIAAGLKLTGLDVTVVHPVELLDAALA